MRLCENNFFTQSREDAKKSFIQTFIRKLDYLHKTLCALPAVGLPTVGRQAYAALRE